MTLDSWHQDTRDLAVRALERADQAHERIDREEQWRVRVEEKIQRISDQVTELHVKVAVVAAAASIAGSVVATFLAKQL